jgi:hypothetical protein
MKNLIVVGSNYIGLSAAYLLKDRFNVKVIDVYSKDDIVKLGNKFFSCKKNVVNFFEKLNIPYNIDYLSRGVLIRGEVYDIFNYFKDMDINSYKRIKVDYFKKTRCFNCRTEQVHINENIKSEVFDWGKRTTDKKFIFFDGRTFVEVLKKNLSDIEFIKSNVKSVGVKTLELNDLKIDYDIIVFTIPIWDIKKFLWLNIPKCNSIKRNLIKVFSRKNLYLEYDYVLTPYTPNNAIFSTSLYEGDYIVEANGDINKRLPDIVGDLYFLFGDYWYIKDHDTLNGPFVYPYTNRNTKDTNKIKFIGKYSEFNSNVIFSDNLKKIVRLNDFS